MEFSFSGRFQHINQGYSTEGYACGSSVPGCSLSVAYGYLKPKMHRQFLIVFLQNMRIYCHSKCLSFYSYFLTWVFSHNIVILRASYFHENDRQRILLQPINLKTSQFSEMSYLTG
jgi:hypothetical protein